MFPLVIFKLQRIFLPELFSYQNCFLARHLEESKQIEDAGLDMTVHVQPCIPSKKAVAILLANLTMQKFCTVGLANLTVATNIAFSFLGSLSDWDVAV